MKHPLLQDLKRNRTKWLMLLPAAIAVILMCYIPMTGIVLAFKEFNIMTVFLEARGPVFQTSHIFSKAEKRGP